MEILTIDFNQISRAGIDYTISTFPRRLLLYTSEPFHQKLLGSFTESVALAPYQGRFQTIRALLSNRISSDPKPEGVLDEECNQSECLGPVVTRYWIPGIRPTVLPLIYRGTLQNLNNETSSYLGKWSIFQQWSNFLLKIIRLFNLNHVTLHLMKLCFAGGNMFVALTAINWFVFTAKSNI